MRKSSAFVRVVAIVLLLSATSGTSIASAQSPELIEAGRVLFEEETFGGNGRTCATCHPPQNNFTLDAEFIAGLPAGDPLFVAEHLHDDQGVPLDPSIAGLEIPALMRGPRALILENIDGFDQPPMFRGTPHNFDGLFTAPYGQSGGVPDLRLFSTGAVMQHATRSLNRIPGVDFRLPSEAELDAMEAFMLSIFARQDQSFDLDQLVKTPAQQRGRDLFFGPRAKCSVCHNGPTLGGGPETFNIGVQNLPENRTPLPECPECGPIGSREGTRAFSPPSLFGVADTAPYMHDNSRPTLRRAVDFYDSPFFNSSPAAAQVGTIFLASEEMDDIVAFLEALQTCGIDGPDVNGRECESDVQTAICPIALSGDDGNVRARSATYPPTDITGTPTTAGTVAVRRARLSSGVFQSEVGLLAWDTAACLPADAEIVRARLRLFVVSRRDVDGRSLSADWFDWSPTVEATDYATSEGDDALSENGACGATCRLAGVRPNLETDFALDNVGNIDVGGRSYLRLHVSGGQPTNDNNLIFASFENPGAPAARIVVEYRSSLVVTPTQTSAGATSTPTPTLTSTPVPTASNTATPIGALADLVELSVSNPPASAAPGSAISVTDTVRNSGSAAAGPSTTKFVLSLEPTRGGPGDRILGGGRPVPALAAGAQSSGTRSVTVPNTTPPGTYFLLACADRPGPPGAVAESDEDNNCSAAAATIQILP